MISTLKQNYRAILLVVGFVFLAVLRFTNLGHSDFIPDETTVMSYFKNLESQSTFSLDFFIQQRKGPMQWLVSYVPFILGFSIYNELAYRFLFAVAGLAALFFFFKFLQLETKNFGLALFATMLLGVNGFLVAFARVVQYQSLNLLFSFAALYLFSRYKNLGERNSSFFGTILLVVSFLSHWDAVFVVPYVIYSFLSVRNWKTIFLNFLLGVLILVPFLHPFLNELSQNVSSQSYFFDRFGLAGPGTISSLKFKIAFYNPFLFTVLAAALVLVSVVWIKRYVVFWIWFIATALVFTFLVKVPGTHVYNLVVPLSILASAGFTELVKLVRGQYKVIPVGLFLAALAFLYFQSYLLFVDPSHEYPWQQEKIFRYSTKSYDKSDLANHLIGFPHQRNWAQVREYLTKYGRRDFSYITNENKTISEYYMDLEYGKSERFYAIGVKNPYSSVVDYKFSQISGKTPVQDITNSLGETVVRMYEIVEK